MLALRFSILIALALTACTQSTPQMPPWQLVNGRDDQPVYRARVPETWRRLNPTGSAVRSDTTTSLCEFFIDDPEGTIRVAVHNFPADTVEERIPPGAQIARWRQQHPLADAVSPCAHGGFVGLCLQGPDIMAWAMQLSPSHFRNLQLPGTADQRRHFRQMRGDYTLKAVGPPAAMEHHRKALTAFARSFELIEEIPTPS